MEEIKINVSGMVCEGCKKRVENSLLTIDGVNEVIANYNNGTVIVKLTKKIEKNILEERIEELGFEVKKD